MLHQETMLLELLGPEKQARLGLIWEATYQSGRVFKYSDVFQCDNESGFKSDVTELHNFDI